MTRNTTTNNAMFRRAARAGTSAMIGAIVLFGLNLVQGCGPKYGGPPPGDGDNTDKEPPTPPGEKK